MRRNILTNTNKISLPKQRLLKGDNIKKKCTNNTYLIQ